MITQYYLLTFAVSIALTLIYAAVWHKHNDISITLCFVLIPLVNLGYVLRNPGAYPAGYGEQETMDWSKAYEGVVLK